MNALVVSYPMPERYAVVSQTEALLDRLCSAEFDAEVHLASGYKLALRIAREHPATQALAQHLRQQPGEIARVFARVEALAHDVIDAQWASPHEAALLALLAIIEGAAPFHLDFAITHAAVAPNAPWVERFVLEHASRQVTRAAFHVSVNAAVSFSGEVASQNLSVEWLAAGFVPTSARTTPSGV